MTENQTGSPVKKSRGIPRRRRILFAAVAAALGIAVACLATELVFRVLEAREHRQSSHTGPGGLWMDDARWGWKHVPGEFVHTTPEFTATGRVNSRFMNDADENPDEDAVKTRILVLGDSHTFATGVSTDLTWPKRLEHHLNVKSGAVRFRTFNAGTTGYNMHQYLLRVTDDGPR